MSGANSKNYVDQIWYIYIKFVIMLSDILEIFWHVTNLCIQNTKNNLKN